LASRAQDRAIETPDSTILHIAATGSVRSRPDRIIVTVPVGKSAATAQAARAATQAAIERLRAALVSAGIDAAAIVTKQPGGWGLVGNEALMAGADMGDNDEDAVSATQGQGVNTVADALRSLNGAGKRMANSLVEIRLTDAAQLARVTPILDDLDLPMAGLPQRSLLDDRAAKNAAVADALRKARAEADTYAQVLSLKIVRINRVSNDCSPVPNDYRAMISGWNAMWGGQDGDNVETQVTACVDFVVAPK
jgi:uncharacterized protein YggE